MPPAQVKQQEGTVVTAGDFSGENTDLDAGGIGPMQFVRLENVGIHAGVVRSRGGQSRQNVVADSAWLGFHDASSVGAPGSDPV